MTPETAATTATGAGKGAFSLKGGTLRPHPATTPRAMQARDAVHAARRPIAALGDFGTGALRRARSIASADRRKGGRS